MCASDCPQATIPPSWSLLHIASDLQQGKQLTIAMLELTCLLDSSHHLEAAMPEIERKTEYQEIWYMGPTYCS